MTGAIPNSHTLWFSVTGDILRVRHAGEESRYAQSKHTGMSTTQRVRHDIRTLLLSFL